jgi:DNA repair photolyase
MWGRTFEPQLREHYFKDKMPDDGSWIFVGSMGDILCWGVPDEWLVMLIDFIRNCKADNKFLIQSKNPQRLFNFIYELREISDKIVMGTTVETNRDTPWSKAPRTEERYYTLKTLHKWGFDTFLSLEPLADFDVDVLYSWIKDINPVAVEIGLENYTNYTIKPSEEKINELLFYLNEANITVVLKDNLSHLQQPLP